MNRPVSIVTFERCYIAAWIVGLINTAANWNATTAAMRANPSIVQMGPSFGYTMLFGGLVIGAAITFMLWYFIARRGSVVAKWIATVFFALGLVSFVASALLGRAPVNLVTILGLLSLVLKGVAIFMLFRPDTISWFNETPAEPVA